jgi:hypothetical protein
MLASAADAPRGVAALGVYAGIEAHPARQPWVWVSYCTQHFESSAVSNTAVVFGVVSPRVW